MKGRILILLPYPKGVAPSQRFRIEHYLDAMEKHGYSCDCHSFLSQNTWDIFYQKGKTTSKVFGIIGGYLRRYKLLFGMRKFDAVFVHRETSPLGIPLIPFVISKIYRLPLLYEYDDAVWLPNVSDGNRFWRFLKAPANTNYLLASSSLNLAGNEWLAEYGRIFNPSTSVLPTVVDTQKGHNLNQNQSVDNPVVGWTGSHSTMKYLEQHIVTLKEVYDEQPFKLVVISDQAPKFDFPEVEFVKWNKNSEASDLLKFHIGIMPLPDEEWVNGKCGFKLIQYMAVGVVPIADDIGVNSSIIDHQENGLLCKSLAEWKENLLFLLKNKQERTRLAEGCRPKVEAYYSVDSQRDKFLHLLDTNLKTHGKR